MKDHISWNEYFMGVAVLSSKRSKDPNTKVGACVVNADKRIIGIGYNGFPFGCSDDEYPWGKIPIISIRNILMSFMPNPMRF